MVFKKNEPLVSVVTPFYNTEKYIKECIESVLNQTYQNWEYILVNNCSTDNSFEIAQRYAVRDERIRLIHNRIFLSQVDNYNHALRHISVNSEYCKIVQADDWIFPECISKMVNVAIKYKNIGIISSYYITESKVLNTGLAYSTTSCFNGKNICNKMLLSGDHYFGSPTSLLIRSDIIRSRQTFYPKNSLYEDTEACYEILINNDFGFVFQVLSFTRTSNESIVKNIRLYDPFYLEKIIMLMKFNEFYIEKNDFELRLKKLFSLYYGFLSKKTITLIIYLLFSSNKKKSFNNLKKFFNFHKNELEKIKIKLEYIILFKHIIIEIVDAVLNPKSTIEKIFQKKNK